MTEAEKLYPAPTSPRRNVYVVDDDPVLVEALTEVLSEEGYRVEGFVDPRIALARLESGGRPDAVLLDWLMPGMSGEEFLGALTAGRIEVPVLLLSALDDPGVFHGRVAAVVRKPFDLDRLLAELARVGREPSQDAR